MTEINEYRQGLKAKIVAFAMQEFYKRGIKAVKMDDISNGLHVSKRTVYEIFGDKEQLLLESIKAQQQQTRDLLEHYAYNEAHNVIDIISYFYKIQMERNHQIEPIFYEEVHKMPRIVEFLNKIHEKECQDRLHFFEVGVQEGLFRSSVDYSLLTTIGHVAMNEIMRQHLYKECPMKSLFDNYFLIMIRGFCTERGLEMLDKAFA